MFPEVGNTDSRGCFEATFAYAVSGTTDTDLLPAGLHNVIIGYDYDIRFKRSTSSYFGPNPPD